MITDDKPRIEMPPGMTFVDVPLNPPQGKGVFFGWLDYRGDANSVRFDEIQGTYITRPEVTPQNLTPQAAYVLLIKGGVGLRLTERDFRRLLLMMGWSEGKATIS